MRPRLIWTNQARADLIDLYAYIAAENLAAAERFLGYIAQAAQSLIDYPKLGKARPDIAFGMRVLVERHYLLLYRIDPDIESEMVATLEIVRVVDGRRDLNALV